MTEFKQFRSLFFKFMLLLKFILLWSLIFLGMWVLLRVELHRFIQNQPYSSHSSPVHDNCKLFSYCLSVVFVFLSFHFDAELMYKKTVNTLIVQYKNLCTQNDTVLHNFVICVSFDR
jgi:hypothetical protein